MAHSIWISFADQTNFPTLGDDLTVDVAIIGAGMTGLATAEALKKSGLKVAVLEKEKIGLGTTSHSTGNLYPAMFEVLGQARKKFNDQVMKDIIQSRIEAIQHIEKLVEEYKIDCDFVRVPWNYFSKTSVRSSRISKALQSAKIAGLKVRESTFTELPFRIEKGITIEGSAQFNPARFIQGLAKGIAGGNCMIFENTNVETIEDNNGEFALTSRNGGTIFAKHVIHATHTPKGIMLPWHAELGPYREYGVAFRMNKESLKPGVYFGYYDSMKHYSTRIYERNGEKFFLVIAEPHKVGHAESSEYFQKIEEFARKYFDVGDVTHRWGGQHYRPADFVPYIGRKTPNSKVYIATGFSTHGLVYGVVAARMFADLITGRGSRYEHVYRPWRFTPVASAGHLIKENADVMYQFVKDYLLKGREKSFSSVKAGEGKVIIEEGHRLAVYRDETEGLHVCSAVCPHMGCVVHWNGGEKSWDCPCHGSRFKTNGDVIEGPAMKALASFEELTGKTITPVQTDDELVDEESWESFPASDPPGHFSKSREDRELHRRE